MESQVEDSLDGVEDSVEHDVLCNDPLIMKRVINALPKRHRENITYRVKEECDKIREEERTVELRELRELNNNTFINIQWYLLLSFCIVQFLYLKSAFPDEATKYITCIYCGLWLACMFKYLGAV